MSTRSVTLPEAADRLRPVLKTLAGDARAGRLQRTVALTAGITSGLSGLEVGYLHYRASYGNPVMWTPIVMSQALAVAGVWGAVQPKAARSILPVVSVLTLADCATGLFFHIRGTHRKPGGWRYPWPNVPMGPPPFAPILFGMSAYMGIVSARMAPERWLPELASAAGLDATAERRRWARRLELEPGSEEARAAERAPRAAPHGLRRHLAWITAVAAGCSAGESFYSHYKNNFQYKMQWTPIVIAPLLAVAAIDSARHPRRRRPLIAAALLTMADGLLGGFYHARGIWRRSHGHQPFYHIMYGPPPLAPGLLAGSGFLGLLAGVIVSQKAK